MFRIPVLQRFPQYPVALETRTREQFCVGMPPPQASHQLGISGKHAKRPSALYQLSFALQTDVGSCTREKQMLPGLHDDNVRLTGGVIYIHRAEQRTNEKKAKYRLSPKAHRRLRSLRCSSCPRFGPPTLPCKRPIARQCEGSNARSSTLSTHKLIRATKVWEKNISM